MPQNLDSCIFRVLKANGETAGLGFIVPAADGGALGVTCAHLAMDAAQGKGPGAEITIYFGTARPLHPVRAVILTEGWSGAAEEDLAFLRLPALPAGVSPVKLYGARSSQEHPFQVGGSTARGKIHAAVSWPGCRDLLEMTADQPLAGLDGAPLLDLIHDRVVGMICSRRRPEHPERTYATTTDTLLAHYTGLVLQDPSAGAGMFNIYGNGNTVIAGGISGVNDTSIGMAASVSSQKASSPHETPPAAETTALPEGMLLKTRSDMPQNLHDRKFSALHVDLLGVSMTTCLKEMATHRQDDIVRRVLSTVGVRIRILFVHPASPYLKQRTVEDNFRDQGRLKANQLESIEYCVRLFELLNKHMAQRKAMDGDQHPLGRLEIKLLNACPYLTIERYDEELYWGLYLAHTEGLNSPMFVAHQKENAYLHDTLKNHFRGLWKNEFPIPRSPYKMDLLTVNMSEIWVNKDLVNSLLPNRLP